MSNTYSRSAEVAESVPSVNIASNNNRIKRYDTNTNQPIYYLHSGKEFQIELFNPTADIIKCNISLNGKLLDGGGLVLKPGQRVFLDRHLNSPEKFIFETYEVGKSNAVEKAIANNGLIKVEFYKEEIPNPYLNCGTATISYGGSFGGPIHTDTIIYPTAGNVFHTTNLDGNCVTTTNMGTTFTSTNVNYSGEIGTVHANNATLDWMDTESQEPTPIRKMGKVKVKKVSNSRKQETGMIGKGSKSNQKFDMVNYDFFYLPFYTVEYKLLPYSQKVNTVDSISVKRYCTECGSKIKANFKFCAQCGHKA